MTSNFISEMDEDAFRNLPQLQELILRENKIRQLPELPPTLMFIDVSNNRLGRKGIKEEAFKVSLECLVVLEHSPPFPKPKIPPVKNESHSCSSAWFSSRSGVP